ncbi:hypothetical protein GEMRC1_003447 [Eukaryota sp. GEM-RC1]
MPPNSDDSATVFIRNLPFSTTSDELSTLCDNIGPVKRAFIIQHKDQQSGTQRSKGIGFVEFCLSSDASEAVNSLNGSQFQGRSIGVDFAKKEASTHQSAQPSTKRKHKPWRLILRNLPFSINTKTLTSFLSPIGSLEDVYLPQKQFRGALSGTGFAFVTYENEADAGKALKKLSGLRLGKREIIFDYAVPKDDYLRVVNQTQEELKPAKTVDGDESGESSEEETEEQVSQDEEEKEEEQEEEEDLKGTVFLRNLSTSATTGELIKLFGKFGGIKEVKIVRDRGTGISRGTAFLKFKNSQHAARCIAECRLAPPFLNEKSIDVLKALKSDETPQHLADNHDKRNLYLASEGDILPDSAAYDQLDDKDKRKRDSARREKEAKLGSPNYCVSATRLLIRNIPVTVTESELKAVAKYSAATAATTFGDENLKKVKISQVKIVKDMEKLDSEGKPKSKGYGFVQFKGHLQTLAALRFLNNNPDIPEFLGKRPIVEFAIDNVVKLQKLQRSKEYSNVKKSEGTKRRKGGGEKKRNRKSSADE